MYNEDFNNQNNYYQREVLLQPLITVTLKCLVVTSSADRDLEILHCLFIFASVEKRIADSDISTSVVSVILQDSLPRLVGFIVLTFIIEV